MKQRRCWWLGKTSGCCYRGGHNPRCCTTLAGEHFATTAVACAAALAIGRMAASGGHSISTARVPSAAVVGRTHRFLVGAGFPASRRRWHVPLDQRRDCGGGCACPGCAPLVEGLTRAALL